MVMLFKKKKMGGFRSHANEDRWWWRQIRGVVIDKVTLNCFYSETVKKACKC